MTDTFAIFDNDSKHQDFLIRLNSMHPSLQFTTETEQNGRLPFLDVLIEKDLDSQLYLTSIYRKPTFTGAYVRYESFCHKNRKVSLIRTLVHRAQQICSAKCLSREILQLKSIFAENGYPSYLVNKIITSKLASEEQLPGKPPDEGKTRVYMRLPFIGKPSYRFERQIKIAIRSCYESVLPHIIFQSRPILPKMRKDILPTSFSQNVVYKFSCYCKGNYVGQTSQTLRKRMSQHVPRCLLEYQQFVCDNKSGGQFDKRHMISVNNAKKQSSICEHLVNNLECLKNYNSERFKPIAQARNSFHLSVLEAIIISQNKPEICKQKDFTYQTLLF